ncbi:MAG: hypothetical protein M3Y87_15325 [Myxococcota bacterium]|nr:hypothetical protein [Myxococcota bacterium]
MRAIAACVTALVVGCVGAAEGATPVADAGRASEDASAPAIDAALRTEDASIAADAAVLADAGAIGDDAGIDPGEGPGVFVAVGWRHRIVTFDTDFTVLHSEERTDADPYDHGLLLRAVTHGPHGFVVVGDDVVLRSTDGREWVAAEPFTHGFLSGVTFGNGHYVAAGGTSAARSADGLTWEVARISRAGGIRDVAFGAGVFVAVGDDGLRARSVDGLVWDSIITADGAGLQGIAFAEGRFVAVGHGGRRVSSTDGITWSHDEAGGEGSFRVVYFDGARWIAAGDLRLATSPDARAASWVEHPTRSRIDGLVRGGGRYVASCGSRICVAEDGLAWEPGAPELAGDSGLWSIAFAPGLD